MQVFLIARLICRNWVETVHTSIDSNTLEYDAAGNLTKDANSYEFEYDYENRVVKVTKDANDIAEFAYDCLGRRIRKIDSVDSNNTR